MPRKKTKSLIRDIPGDRKYGSVLVQKIINKTMQDGKKQKAEAAVYQAMELAATKLKSKDPLKTIEQAIDNIRPSVEVRSRRVGGANYQIPFPVQGNRQTHLTLMWFIEAARSRRKSAGKPFAEVMAAEIVDAVNETGSAVKKKEDVHRMAEANRAFAHFARY
ncbi:TPA: 30S ribosomal protein S7 [Candidatus Saccharibacteria bacterium]|nr:30S ribosomal protein S7 [Candidatus Saccharibacteria bacterium]HIO87412.1 30S ribosomal protein S7 [Candidatus Saccharibacteria bacterium]